jgi:hypothetical protein
MDTLFIQAIQTAFNTAANTFAAAGLPPVRHIDKYRGQPINPEEHEGFELPAIFYSMRCRWERQGKLYNANMSVDFHVVQDATWETSSISENQLSGLEQLAFLSMVRCVLDNVTSPHTSKLTRLDETPVDVGVTVYDVLTYTGEYYEQNVVGSTSSVTIVTPELEIEGKLKVVL